MQSVRTSTTLGPASTLSPPCASEPTNRRTNKHTINKHTEPTLTSPTITPPSRLVITIGTIGREAEFPVVERNGEAGDVQRLMRSLMGMDSTLEVTCENGEHGPGLQFHSIPHNVEYRTWPPLIHSHTDNPTHPIPTQHNTTQHNTTQHNTT